MRAYLLIFSILISFSVLAQEVDLSSPRATIGTFYNNLSADEPNIAEASKVISSRHIMSKNKRQELVQSLYEYISSKEFVIDLSIIPVESDYIDSVSEKNYYELNSIIAIEKIGSHWYLSKETVNNIKSLDPNDDVAEIKQNDGGLFSDMRRQNKEREAELEKIAQMPVDLSSPYATMKLYIENIEEDPAVASRIVSRADIPNMLDRIDIVEKLNRFLRGKGVILNLDNIPEEADYTDSTRTSKYTYELTYRFSDIYLQKEGKNWFLSKESAEKLPVLHSLAFPFGSDRLLQYIPTEGRHEFLGLYAWQYIAILILIILTYLIFRFLDWIITFVTTKTLIRFGHEEVTKAYVKPTVRPVGLLIAFILADTAMPFLQLPIKANAFISVTVEILIPFFATVAFYQGVNVLGVYLQKAASKTESTFDDQIVPLVEKVLKTFVVVIGAVIILSHMNVNVGVLLGTLSVGGLALALAAQDTIKNFFGSLMIFLDKPFQAGHWVTTSDGLDGTVEKVGFRSTRIRTFSNSVISIPNGRLSDHAIDNHGLRSYRRFKTTIQIQYDTPPELLELFIDGLREIVENHPHTRKDMFHIYLNEMGSHSLNILFYIFFITPEWGKELLYRHQVIIATIKLAQTIGVQFAYPTQTLHMETFPGKDSLSTVYDSIAGAEPKMKKFIEDYKRQDSESKDE